MRRACHRSEVLAWSERDDGLALGGEELACNLGDLLQSFRRILVPEMNQGQLVTLLRSEYLVPAKGLSKVTGKPFTVAELDAAIATALEAAP